MVDEPGGECLERARKLAPAIAAAGDDIERARRITEPLLSALHEAGMFRLLLPRSLGGAELDPASFVRVIEEVARHDASIAWVLCQTAGCSMSAAYLDPGVAREIFGPARGVLAWGPPAPSRAVVVDGGYRVTGTWRFASGGRHATWLGGWAPIVEADGTSRRHPDGTPAGRTMLFPAASVTMIDVWDVIGLRGTGSDTFSAADVLVPHAYSIVRDDEAERREAGPLYCFPITNLYAAGFAAVALGIARAVLDAFLALARDKTPRGFARPLFESPVIQSAVAQAEARVAAARGWLLASLEEIWQTVRPPAITLEQRIRIRLAATHAIHQAQAVVDDAYHGAGATAIFAGSAFERRFRDIHTVAQQVQGRRDHYENVGKFLLGLPPDTQFL